jgi:hypothetical protein
VDVDPGVVVGPVGVAVAADLVQRAVDLDRVDVVGPVGQRRGHVVAAAGADDEHVAGVQARGLGVVAGVERVVRHRHRGLVGHLVDLDGVAAGLVLLVLDLVVRRPRRVGGGRLDPQHGDEGADGQNGRDPHLRQRHRDEHRAGHDPPHDGRHPQERQDREPDDAGDAAHQVELVRLQRLELLERPGHAVGDEGEDRGRDHEDHRQDDLAGRPRGPEVVEEEELAARHRDVDGEQPDERHQQRQHDRRPREQRPPAPPGPDEPEADAEEAPEQHQVGEVGEEDDVRARPPDDRQLDEQHEEAEQDQARLVADQPGRFGRVRGLPLRGGLAVAVRLRRHRRLVGPAARARALDAFPQ